VWLFLLRAGRENMKCSKSERGLTESLLIITGTMGAGKTAVLAEASDILAERQIVHAAVDLDALGLAHLPSLVCGDRVMYDNLRSICGNYAAVGVQRFLLARAIEDDAELQLCRDTIRALNTVVCRLTASIETMAQRVELRELGISRRDYVARVAKLNVILDRVRLEDFAVTNENRSLSDVALEMLVEAGWISN
jgi:phosphosulfolactate synthase (CoM biosynthesis protein A)